MLSSLLSLHNRGFFNLFNKKQSPRGNKVIRSTTREKGGRSEYPVYPTMENIKRKKAKGINSLLSGGMRRRRGERKVILKAWDVISSKQQKRCERAMRRPVKISIFSDLSTLGEKETKRRCLFSPLLRVHHVVLIILSTLIT